MVEAYLYRAGPWRYRLLSIGRDGFDVFMRGPRWLCERRARREVRDRVGPGGHWILHYRPPWPTGWWY